MVECTAMNEGKSGMTVEEKQRAKTLAPCSTQKIVLFIKFMGLRFQLKGRQKV